MPPAWLGDVGRAKWAELYGALVKRIGMIPDLDRDVLSIYCDAWQCLVNADRTMAREGEMIDSGKGYKVAHPAARRRDKAVDLIKKLGIELGLTPNARRGLDVAVPEVDPLDEFLAE